MTKKTKPFHEIRLERLANPIVAAEYLNATRHNSPDNLLTALKTVAQARCMATVAKDAGVQRETLYRSLSEQGNPRYDTLDAVLAALGLDFEFKPRRTATSANPPAPVANTLTSPTRPSGIQVWDAIIDKKNLSPYICESRHIADQQYSSGIDVGLIAASSENRSHVTQMATNGYGQMGEIYA